MKTTYGNGMSSKIQGRTVGGNRREREREREGETQSGIERQTPDSIVDLESCCS